MTQGQTGWILLLILSIVLIVIGLQGNLGKTIAIIFCPSEITIAG